MVASTMKPNRTVPLKTDAHASSENMPAAANKKSTPVAVEYLWVDARQEKPHGQTLSGAKQTFLKTKHHRRRREAQLQKLKGSIVPFPDRPSSNDDARDIKSTTKKNGQRPGNLSTALSQEPVLYRGIETGLEECFPSLSLNTSLSMNQYFKHCKYDIFTICSEHLTHIYTHKKAFCRKI